MRGEGDLSKVRVAKLGNGEMLAGDRIHRHGGAAGLLLPMEGGRAALLPGARMGRCPMGGGAQLAGGGLMRRMQRAQILGDQRWGTATMVKGMRAHSG